ncbi:MAG: hypothetical protein JZU50_06525 [Desulfobulbaceae bacterium]|nr:hypothetical protein [Desulfobulbaceae bacterium]
MKAAVIAHYDPENVWDKNFLAMLSVVSRLVDRVVVVTTSTEIGNLPASPRHVELVRRPNIGYDFYSYRVGLTCVLRNGAVDGVFLLNSSVILFHAKRFAALLNDMASEDHSTGVRGVTASKQFAWHIQSYLIYFDLRKLPPYWLQRFFSNVQPVNSKFEVVLAYEIGLGNTISSQQIRCAVCTKALFALAWDNSVDENCCTLYRMARMANAATLVEIA